MTRRRRQNPAETMMMVAQSTGDSAMLGAPLRDGVRGLDVNMLIFNVRTMEQLFRARATSIFRLLVTMVAAMGPMGPELSIVGCTASSRTRRRGARVRSESAWRLASPPRRSSVWCSVKASCALWLCLVLGLVGSVGAGALLAYAFPSGDDQQDFLSLVLVAPVVLAVTVLATYIPARRASQVNPMDALPLRMIRLAQPCLVFRVSEPRAASAAGDYSVGVGPIGTFVRTSPSRPPASGADPRRLAAESRRN